MACLRAQEQRLLDDLAAEGQEHLTAGWSEGDWRSILPVVHGRRLDAGWKAVHVIFSVWGPVDMRCGSGPATEQLPFAMSRRRRV